MKFRNFWLPDPVFENQDHLEKVRSTIENSRDLTFEVQKTCFTTEKPKVHYMATFPDNIVSILEQTIKVVVNCPDMEFSAFPLDTQVCDFYMRDVWQDKLVTWLPAVVDITGADFYNPEFTITARNQTKEDGFSGLEVVLVRKSRTYLYTYFYPCSMMVVTSWVSFSVKAEVVPGRLGLLLTLLLMMINLTNSASKIIPGSDSLCPLILWIWLSIGFVGVALLEYFVILTSLKFCKTKVSITVMHPVILLHFNHQM